MAQGRNLEITPEQWRVEMLEAIKSLNTKIDTLTTHYTKVSERVAVLESKVWMIAASAATLSSILVAIVIETIF